ncbi:hypothetical protein [Streptomyces sp. NPDC006996]|uniref:hypothetical protein n=1 Tax=Streptomyces sp. NPDC006996 TaxID=3156908 RepID=UPI0033C64268
MAAHSNRRTPFAWTEKGLGDDVPPDRQRLAFALQEMCRRLTVRTPEGEALTHPTQAQAAKHLKISETALTRYLHGQHVPADKVTVYLYDTACRDAGGQQNLGIAKKELLALRARAAQERCGNCSRHREAARAAGQKLKLLQENQQELERTAEEKSRELRAARQQVSVLKQETQRARNAQPVPEAGPQEGRTAATAATLLPVRRRQGDRQQSKNETAAALSIASRVKELLSGGRPDSTLALLLHTVEASSPAEIALSVALLRTMSEHELAGNLVHIYGRERSDRDVVHTALKLHEQDAVADAEALLHAATLRPRSAI